MDQLVEEQLDLLTGNDSRLILHAVRADPRLRCREEALVGGFAAIALLIERGIVAE